MALMLYAYKQIVQMITTMQENKNTVYENELEFIKSRSHVYLIKYTSPTVI